MVMRLSSVIRSQPRQGSPDAAAALYMESGKLHVVNVVFLSGCGLRLWTVDISQHASDRIPS